MSRQPEGRYMRLESALNRNHHGRRPADAYRRFNARKNLSSSWVVLYPGQPEVGDKIRIRLAPKPGGGPGYTQDRWVAGIVVPADRRADGQSIVSVSKSPVPRAVKNSAAIPPPPRPPPLLTQRNPRICEECERPCRPGAGMCDACKGAMRAARVAADGGMLKPWPEPSDVF